MDPTVQSWVELISQVGFPIIVAGYVLLRLDKQMQQVISKLKDLRQEIELCLKQRGP